MGGPVKRQPDWHECATPTTPSHIRAYMDACKEWLLSTEEEEAVEDDLGVQASPVVVDGQKNANIGLLAHVPTLNVFACFLCEAETRLVDGQIVTANPFTRSSNMLLCNACHLRLRDFDRQ